MPTSTLIAIGVGLVVLGVVVAFFAARAADRRVAALRRAVRRLAGTTLPSWRWTERDDLPGLTNELGAITTRLRERLEELTEGRDRAGQILDALDDGVLLLDGAGRLLIANPAARSWFGLPNDLRPGLPLKRVLGAPQVSALAEQAAEARAPVVGNLTLVFPEPRTLALRAFALADRGPTGRIVVTMTDITQRRRLEVLRRDFVANASHELKTPVAAVRALAETLLTALPDDPEAGRRFAERIGREAERLDLLTRDLLDLSRVEQGALDVEPVDLVGLVKELRRVLSDHDPAAVQPNRQRPAIHPGQGSRLRPPERRREPGCAPGARHRAGHPGRGAFPGLRALLPGRQGQGPPDRRDRSRPGHRPPRRRGPWRHRPRRQRARPRVHVHGGPPGCGAPAAPRGLTRHQPTGSRQVA